MNKKYILNSLSVILMIFIFSSCITIERNIKINEDGSGKETTTVTYGKAFFDFIVGAAVTSSVSLDSAGKKSVIDSIFNEKSYADEIKDKYKKLSGVKLNEVIAKFNSDSTLKIKINYSFDKIEKISSTFQALEDEKGSFGDGKTEITFKKDGKIINFRYKYLSASDEDTNRSLRNSLSGFFNGEKMVFNITFPYSITSSNAAKTNGKTLTWEFDMDKLMTDMNIIDLRAEIKKETKK